MSKQLSRRLEEIREELKKPIPPHSEDKKMSTPRKKKAPAKKVAKRKAPAKKVEAPVTDGISLTQLADDAGITPSKARQKLRAAGIEKPGGRWEWPPKAKSLKEVQKVLAG